MQLLKLIFSIALIIFNYINFANGFPFFEGGDGFLSYYIGNKLYYRELSYFFYVDLTGVSLDNDTIIDTSKWFDLEEIKPQPESEKVFANPIVGGKDNDKLMFLDSADDINYENVYK